MKMGPIGCPETSVSNYHYSLRNDPEERSCHLLRGGTLESRTENKFTFWVKFSVFSCRDALYCRLVICTLVCRVHPFTGHEGP